MVATFKHIQFTISLCPNIKHRNVFFKTFNNLFSFYLQVIRVLLRATAELGIEDKDGDL